MSPLRRFLLVLSGAVTGSPRRTLGIALLLGLLAVPGLLGVTVSGDLSKLLPRDGGPAHGLALWLEGFAASEALYGLLEADSADPELLAEIGEELSEALEGSELVVSAAMRPADGPAASDPLFVLDLLEAEDQDELARRTTPEGLAARAGGLKNLLMSPLGADTRDLLLRDPLGLLEMLGAKLGSGVQRLDSAGGGFLAPDGEALLLMIRPAPPEGPPREFAARLEADLAARAQSVLDAHPRGGELTFGVTGGPLYARHIEDATRADGARLALVSILAVLLLYLGFYRSFHSLGTMLLLLPYSALLTLGGPGLLLGELTPMAAGFAAILFGLGVDPAVHLTSRYREARTKRPPRESAMEAVRSVGPAVVVASLTTAAALQGMSFIGSRALAQMGLLAGMGVLVNAAVMLMVLPALWIVLGDRISPDPGVGRAAATAAARFVHRRSAWIIGAYGLLALGLLLGRGPLPFSVSMEGFRPASLEPVRVDRAIDAHFGGAQGRMVVLLRGDDEQAVLRANDAWAEALQGMVGRDGLTSFESLTLLKPSEQTVRARRAAVTERVDFAATADALEAALVAEGFVAAPFAAALDGLRGYAVGEATGAASAPWLAWFAEKHVARVGDEWRVATHLHRDPGSNPKALYDALLAAAPPPEDGVEAMVTGLPLVEFQAERTLEAGIGPLVVAALIALLFVLGLHYRRPRVALIAFVPLGGGLLVFLGLYAVAGVPMTFFAMAGIPLLMGVGIDDHLFMLDRYLERGGRPGRLDDTLVGAGRAVVVTTLTTLAAFGVLALSRFDALASMGTAVALALAIAFFSSVVLLPALLARFLPGPDAP